MEKKLLIGKIPLYKGMIFLFVFAILFFISPDSYTHEIYGRTDSAIFFMSGKALMNGMTPYVDYSDSKGLLLWVIYGIGYLLSPTNYHGVFWISVILWFSIFYFCYKILRLYFNDKEAIFGTFLMSIPFFIHLFYYETRAECFCTLPVVQGIYATQLFLRSNNETKLLKNVYALGVGTMCCFLIKWSISVMMLSFIFSILLFCSERKVWIKIFITFLCGLITSSIPFLVYFLQTNNLNNFLIEYIVGTGKTVSSDLNMFISDYISRCVELFTTRRFVYVLYIVAAAYICLSLKKKEYLTNVLCAMAFVFMSIVHDLGYYLYIASSFGIFFVIVVVKFAERKCIKTEMNFVLIFLCFIVCTLGHFKRLQLMGYKNYRYIYNDKKVKESYENADIEMLKVKSPKVLCLNCGEKGIGMKANTLPACKYWTYQIGMTKEMQDNAIKCLKERKADFVICMAESERDNELVKNNGYQFVTRLIDCTNVRNIYKRNNIE